MGPPAFRRTEQSRPRGHHQTNTPSGQTI